MVVSPAILLVASFVVDGLGVPKPSFTVTSPERVVAQTGRIDFMLFAGRGAGRNQRVMQPPRNTRDGDRFRKELVVIWSDSTNSMWSLLPNSALGSRRTGTTTPIIAADTINFGM